MPQNSKKQKLHNLITQISTDFINLKTEDINAGISNALEMIGRFAGVDRSFILCLSEDGKELNMAYEWHHEDFEPSMPFYQNRPIGIFEAIANENPPVTAVHIPRVAEMPDRAKDLRDILLQREVKSFIVVPMTSIGGLIGVLGFAALKKEQSWSDEIVSLLEKSGQTFANALHKKQTEIVLEESEKRFRTLIENLGEGILYCDREDLVIHVNSRFCELTGFTIDEVLGQPAYDLFLPSDETQKFQEHTKRRLEGLAEEYEIQFLKKNGSRFWAHVSSTPIKDAHNQVIGTLGAITDISERKKAQQALIEQKDFLNQVINTSPNLIFAKDLEGRFTLVNKALSQLMGLDPEEIIGKKASDFYHDSSEYKRFTSQDKEVIETGCTKIIPEEEVRAPLTEEARWYHTIKKPLVSSDGKFNQILGVSIDLTERKQVEEENIKLQQHLTQSQKMEAIGQLAAGIAHDLNNSLSAVVGHLQLVTMDPSATSQIKSSVDVALSGCERATSMIEHLLGFSRQGKYDLQTLSVQKALKETLKFLKRIINPNIKTTISAPKEMLYIKADKTQFQQALTNIIINAQQAMDDSGKLEFEFSTETVSFPERFNADAKAGSFVVLKIKDNGIGMEQAILDKIFEPFFTTKGPGKGTGLGLSMVYGIMQNHAGWIRVESTLGEGSIFSLYFRQVAAEQEEEEFIREPETDRAKHSILVIDDEPFLVDLAQKFLTRSGYEAKSFTNGREAIKWYESHHQEISLIILDMKMPGMDGKACFDAIRAINPNALVIILSGYIQDEAAQYVLNNGAKQFFQKPLRYQELMDAVANLLESNS